MVRGRPIPPLHLSEEERSELERWTRRAKTSQALALRARIVLECAAGRNNITAAQDLRVSNATVSKWRRRFLARGLDSLVDEPRSGTPRRVSDEQVEHVLTLETTPADATHWSTRAMAQRSGLGRNTISRIWRAFGLQPHRTETFKLSRDPLFIDKVRDIVGLYLNPPERALVGYTPALPPAHHPPADASYPPGTHLPAHSAARRTPPSVPGSALFRSGRYWDSMSCPPGALLQPA